MNSFGNFRIEEHQLTEAIMNNNSEPYQLKTAVWLQYFALTIPSHKVAKCY